MGGCLDGVRVLELARYQAGPRGGMILSDLGAEVIKIEKIGGEETRRSEPVVRGQSVYFAVYNRGKKSLCKSMRDLSIKSRVLGDGYYYIPIDLWPKQKEPVVVHKHDWTVISSIPRTSRSGKSRKRAAS
jgi:hypothetical protein